MYRSNYTIWKKDFKRSPYYSLCIKYYILHIISSILINTRQNKTTCCMALNVSQVIMKWSNFLNVHFYISFLIHQQKAHMDCQLPSWTPGCPNLFLLDSAVLFQQFQHGGHNFWWWSYSDGGQSSPISVVVTGNSSQCLAIHCLIFLVSSIARTLHQFLCFQEYSVCMAGRADQPSAFRAKTSTCHTAYFKTKNEPWIFWGHEAPVAYYLCCTCVHMHTHTHKLDAGRHWHWLNGTTRMRLTSPTPLLLSCYYVLLWEVKVSRLSIVSDFCELHGL